MASQTRFERVLMRIQHPSAGEAAVSKTAAVLLLLALACSTASLAQQATAARLEQDSPGIAVYLISVGPGRRVWEKFGHNAIWISDNETGTDRAYNYGLFSFEQEDFLSRFLRGRMLYWMRGFDVEGHIQEYIDDDRSVWIQELNLTPAQRIALRDFLLWNERPEHRFYRYHYYYDNCSTRIRDALDRVLGGAIRSQTEGVETGNTFRFHTLRLTSDNIWTYTGLLLGLGQPVDRPISEWDEMFLPLKLRDHLRGVTLRDESGNESPLVVSERTEFESTVFAEASSPPNWLLGYFVVGLAIAACLAFTAYRAAFDRLSRAVFAVLATLWAFLTGVAGLVLAGLWAFTDHNTSYRNENLFWFDPLAIMLVALAPLLIRGVPWAARPGRLVASAIGALSLLGFVLQIAPGLDQVNGPLIALALPPNLAMAAGLLWVSRTRGQTGVGVENTTGYPECEEPEAASFPGAAEPPGRL